MKLHRMLLVAIAAATVTLATVVQTGGGPAEAGVFAGQIITSAGPLTQIFVANDLGCQVEHTGDSDFQFFPSGDQQGNCGTFLLVGSTLYGDFGSWGNSNEYTPVSQSAVTGSGTSGSPYQVVTVVDAGTTGIRITQTDSYVVGDEFYRTDIQVANTSGSAAAVKLYRGADCYLGGSDSGYGYLDAGGGVVGCSVNPNNVPSGRVELWTPITPGNLYYHEYYGTVRSVIESGGDFPNSCACGSLQDNGAGIQWNANINNGANSTFSHYTTFSPTGIGAPTPTPGGPTNTPGPQGSVTPTEERPAKTHTPTLTTTAEPSETPAPATNTAVPANTVAPPPPSGGGQGIITAPDTGSGGNHGSERLSIVAAGILLVLGTLTLGIAGASARKDAS